MHDKYNNVNFDEIDQNRPRFLSPPALLAGIFDMLQFRYMKWVSGFQYGGATRDESSLEFLIC